METIYSMIVEEFNFIKNNISETLLLSLLGTILLLFFFSLLKSRFLLFAIFTLPATLFHELSHYIVSLLTFGNPSKLSIFPKKDGSYWVMGYVSSQNINFLNGALISLAPISLIPLGYFFIKHFMMGEENMIYLSLETYILASMIEGSIPSKTDIEIAISTSWPILILFSVFLLFY